MNGLGVFFYLRVFYSYDFFTINFFFVVKQFDAHNCWQRTPWTRVWF
jgi:hypothetical protein